MSAMDPDLSRRLRRARKRPIFEPETCGTAVNIGRDELARTMRHRGSMLLLDSVERMSIASEAPQVVAHRRVDPADPILAGHFPDEPIYPGFLMLEMMGQAGLVLHHCHETGALEVAPDAKPASVRLLKVHGAIFVSEARPGDALVILSAHMHFSGMSLIAIGQVLNRTHGDRVVAAGVMEAILP